MWHFPPDPGRNGPKLRISGGRAEIAGISLPGPDTKEPRGLSLSGFSVNRNDAGSSRLWTGSPNVTLFDPIAWGAGGLVSDRSRGPWQRQPHVGGQLPGPDGGDCPGAQRGVRERQRRVPTHRVAADGVAIAVRRLLRGTLKNSRCPRYLATARTRQVVRLLRKAPECEILLDAVITTLVDACHPCTTDPSILTARRGTALIPEAIPYE